MDAAEGIFKMNRVITVGPILLLLAMSAMLGFASYQIYYAAETRNFLEVTQVGARPIVNLMKRSVGGGNYANVQDGDALELYKANGKMLFFSATGKTDLAGDHFGVVYDAVQERIVRVAYPANYEQTLRQRLEQAQSRLNTLSADDEGRSRIQRIAEQLGQQLQDFESDAKTAELMLGKFLRPAADKIQQGHYLDTDNWQLHVMLPTGNQAGGEIWMVLDAAELGSLWQRVLWKVLPMNLAALVICGGLLMWLLSSHFTRPIGQMLSTIKEIESSSDLTRRFMLGQKNEIGVTAAALNNMLVKIQNTMGSVSMVSGKLEEASQKMVTVTDGTNHAVKVQQGQIDQIAAAIEQISATVQNVAQHAAGAEQAAQQAHAETAGGKLVVAEVIQAIGTLAQEVNNAAEVIHQLDKQSADIGLVLEVIQGIAEQTNLLALNAAIEAARAGEHGRGFAVVADEVRTLAQRTHQSTQEIQRIIQSLQSGAQAAVQVMAEGRNRASDSVDRAAKAGESLECIAQAVSTITEMNSQIACASEEQTAAAQDISSNVTQISHMAEQTALGAETTAEAGAEVSKLASQLRGLVKQFHV